MDKKYRIVFLGLTVSEKDFSFQMSRLGLSPEQIRQVIDRAPVILKNDLPLKYARKYADAVQQAGGRVNIQENGFFEKEMEPRPLNIEPLESFVMCPECGHKQHRESLCEKCGFRYG